jgi:signal transduction histidine kinase
VFKNLILNAIDSMDESREKRLSIRTEVDKDSSTISVNIEDTGCGIGKDSTSKIFMPHYTSKQHGTGLGLPVVKNVVEKNKGKIYVESEVGQGTTFMVSLPLEEGGRGS